MIGIADTRVISGNENISGRKISVYEHDGHSFFLMTSGLRSVRDKAVAYFEEMLEEEERTMDRFFKVVNSFAAQIRRVAAEDRQALEEGGLRFNIFCIMGGKMANDSEHRLYLLYPEANWVEIGPGTPYHIIGSGGYGKPVLDRTLKFDDSMQFALKVGCLAFDSTRISAADVDFPIDVVLLFADGRLAQHRFEKEDLIEISEGWHERLRNSVANLPAAWLNRFFDEIEAPRHPEALTSERVGR